MRLKELAAVLGCDIDDRTDRDVAGITCDSREVEGGYIFVAIEGNEQDGNRFIPEAIAKGAIAVVSAKAFNAPDGVIKIISRSPRKALADLASVFYNCPSNKLNVIGVTGTNGKTTTTYLIKSIFEEAGFGTGLIGTIDYNVKTKHIMPTNTTPGSVQLQRLLSLMVKEKLKYAVMEVTSHALSQDRVRGIDFKAGVFTNLTRDHLDYHENFQNYFNAKSFLFQGLGDDAHAVLNTDDKWAQPLMRKVARARIYTYAIDNEADFKAENISLSLEGMKFAINSQRGALEIRSRLIGRHNVYNILAAVSTASAFGVEPALIQKGVEKLGFVPGRLEMVDAGQDFHLFVDYAHTDDALNNVLTLLKEFAKGRLVVVFGCGGDRDKTKRPLMGRAAASIADYTILTSDNPRSEKPEDIIRDIEKGIAPGAEYEICVDRREAIERAISLAKPQDIILIAGKGHEAYQIYKTKTVPFDDRDVAREILCRVLK